MNIFDGPTRESLFERPLMQLFRHNPLPELFSKAQKIDDDRFVAVLTALAVEDRLDACLGAFLPRYSKLLETQDFGFAKKIRLLQALEFVPRHILSATDLIRDIRNKFAHNLNIETFEFLPQSLRDRIVNLQTEIFSRFGVKSNQPKQPLREAFNQLAFVSMAGLDTYSENLAVLRRQISNSQFIDGLYALVAAENEEYVRKILATPPVSVEIRDGMKIESYSQGLVNISDAPPTEEQ